MLDCMYNNYVDISNQKCLTKTGAHPEIFKEGGSDKGSRQKWLSLILFFKI